MEIEEVFTRLKISKLEFATFESSLLKTKDISIVFFWGPHCPNCEVAKKSLQLNEQDLLSFNIRWFHVNAYEESDLATRFGLHGIPVFLVFRDAKLVGKITSYPGWEEFRAVLEKLCN